MDERNFIKSLKPLCGDDELIVGIGDDAAVIDRGDKFELVSTDMFVEGDHFRLDWFNEEQIGMKAVECSVSDIFAMGGKPKYIFVSICVPKKASEDFMAKIFGGIKKIAAKYNIILAGGDTTHGEKVVIDVAVIGEVKKENLVLRSGAKTGDKICVTGVVGNGAAGLELFRKDGQEAKWNHEYAQVVQKYLEPAAPFEKGPLLGGYASAMIDVSDGVGSEVRHICERSGVGAIVYADKIPLSDQVVFVSTYVKKRALNFALSGGEDFEILFAISEEKLHLLAEKENFKSNIDYYIIGEITEDKGIWLLEDGIKKVLPGGYDHFGE